MSNLILSYSKIQIYQNCPLQYKLAYIDKLQRIERSYFSFGSSLHAAAEFMYKKSVPPPPSLSEVLNHYKNNWVSKGYKDEQEEKEHFDYGLKILKEFYRKNAINYEPALAVEEKFIVDIDRVSVECFIDRIDKANEGSLAIIDYKSGKAMPKNDDLKRDNQLSLYRIAVEKMYGLPVERQIIYLFRYNEEISVTQSEEQLEKTKEMVLEVRQKIDNKIFEPTLNNFCPCDWPSWCPYFKDEYGPPPVEEESYSLERLSLEEIIDRFGQLKQEDREKRKELDALKDRIIDYCLNHNLLRLEGKNYRITLSPIKTIDYPENEVRQELEDSGLWNEVSVFKPKLLDELIKNGKVNTDLIKKFKSLPKIKESLPLRIK